MITFPCGPWGGWSRINLAMGDKVAETVERDRALHRPILKSLNSTVAGRLEAGRHIVIEHPGGSEAFAEPEMKEVKRFIGEGVLLVSRPDGCRLGYKDAKS